MKNDVDKSRLFTFYTLATYNKIMTDTPHMSGATKELLKKVRMMVPPMLDKFHKGISCLLAHHSEYF